MNQVITIRAFGDNFIYLCQYDKTNAFVVDPAEGSSVLRILQKNNLQLTHIFITHHHFDHTAGIAEIKKETDCQVIAGDKRIPNIDRTVKDGDIIELGSEKMKVIATPGHTKTSLCYYLAGQGGKDGTVFTGDTLFVAGCGRVFETDAKTMFESLKKLAALPPETIVYGGHNYIKENYEFALTVEPDNETAKQLLQKAKEGKIISSTISQEKQTNVFLRADSVEAFAKLRKRKDYF